MSAALSVIPAGPRGVLGDMSDRYGMDPRAFEATVRATCMPMMQGKRVEATREEFAAFLLVAREYRLNPITREIYAFPRKGGGIVPIVSVDGWLSLVNSHPECDGFEFRDEHDEKGTLISCTCSIYRKDRSRPVVVTEYLSECIRDTDPWKMKHRMLRHKAMIQAARYAFGFSGIYDEDEARIIADASNGAAPRITKHPPPAEPAMIEHETATGPGAPVAQDAGATFAPSSSRDEEASASAPSDDGIVPLEDVLADLRDRLSHARTEDEVHTGYEDFGPDIFESYEGGTDKAEAIVEERIAALQKRPEAQGAQPAPKAKAAKEPPTSKQPPAASEDVFPGDLPMRRSTDPQTLDEYRAVMAEQMKTMTREQFSEWFHQTADLRKTYGATADEQKAIRAEVGRFLKG